MTARRLASLLLIALVVALAPTAGVAGAAAPRTSLDDVEAEVMCVSCGVPLAIAESPQADAERREITRLIKQGKTKDEIKSALVATYGNRVLASPKDEGFGLAAYLVPIVLALIALAAGALLLPKWRAKNRGDDNGQIAADGPALSDADARRLDDDLARYGI
ncbi:MAG TPA: cytochrome c-type biogenesis protein CcmH [Baekduia sp.]|nr:cytochrome c-type biogenesis protein CcmH [Baekduia sp.]